VKLEEKIYCGEYFLAIQIQAGLNSTSIICNQKPTELNKKSEL
jgi:hypothetical protein